MSKNQINNEESQKYRKNENLNKVEDNKVITEAKRILKTRMKLFGTAFTTPSHSTDFLLLELSELEAERFDVIFLNNQHQLIAHIPMFFGTIDGASVYPREVAKKAIELNAAAVIFGHNHPSGVTSASQADKDITKKLKDGLKLFDIRVLDHIIVAGNQTLSFANEGFL